MLRSQPVKSSAVIGERKHLTLGREKPVSEQRILPMLFTRVDTF
jgi:hypothetical protein